MNKIETGIVVLMVAGTAEKHATAASLCGKRLAWYVFTRAHLFKHC